MNAQAALLPELEPPADQPAHFAVMGLLRDAARVFVQPTTGRVSLQVVITQHLQRHPEARHVLATYQYPDLGTPHATQAAAHDKARRMPAGCEVIAKGSLFLPGEYHGEPVLVLADVAGIAIHHDLAPVAHGD